MSGKTPWAVLCGTSSPPFRIGDEAVGNDVKLVLSMGAKVVLNTEVREVRSLFAQGYTHVILATGAWSKGSAGLEYGEARNVIAFLEQAKKAPETLDLGENVVVIGGGNTAMDAARAAVRLPGVKRVSLVYRRTRRYMPADQEELELALADGVEFRELLAPVGVKDGVLTCREMELGPPDTTGRRSPVDTGRVSTLPASAVIAAVGERVDTALYTANGLDVDGRGKAVVDPETLESSVKHVYVIGDGQKGPGTVVEAIAGGRPGRPGNPALGPGALRGAECQPRLPGPSGQTRGAVRCVQEQLRNPLSGLRHRVRDLYRGLPQPGQCTRLGPGQTDAPDSSRGRPVQRVRQLRRLLPLHLPPLPG